MIAQTTSTGAKATMLINVYCALALVQSEVEALWLRGVEKAGSMW